MNRPKAVLFDLDDTLAESFQPPSSEMIHRLELLLPFLPVAIITGAGFERIYQDTVSRFSNTDDLTRLYLFPNSSAECHVFQGSAWIKTYSMDISESEQIRIKEAIDKSIRETGILKDVTVMGQQYFDRVTQIAFAFLGDTASKEVKKTWDQNGAKRASLLRALSPKLPEYEIRIGGTTTIDITKKGIDKAYGVEWFSEHLSIPTTEMLYIGDAFFPGGNDEVVRKTGIPTRPVSGPEETGLIIDELLAEFNA